MRKIPPLLFLLSGLLLWNGQISFGDALPPQTAPNVDALKDDPFKEIPPQPAQPEPAPPANTITSPPPATLPIAKTPVTPPPVAALPPEPVAAATPTPAAIFAEPAASATPNSMAHLAATPAPIPEIAPLTTPAPDAAAATMASPSPSATPEMPLPELAASPAPQAVPAASPEDQPALEEPKFGEEGYVSKYEKSKAAWAYGARVAFNGFPFTYATVGDSYQLYVEYILPYQKLGDFSVGFHLGSFPLSAPETGIPYPVYENYSVGVSARYALRYARDQIFVPVGGFELDYYSLKKGMGPDKITGTNPGGIIGLMLALDPLDPRVARDSYEELGMVHAYFTFEVRSISMSNDLFNLNAALLYFGLRLEFE